MEGWILEVVARYGYLGVFLMIALENVFPPIPSEVILTFGGFMVAVTSMNTFGVVSAATAGSLLGAAALYLVGRQLGQERVERLVERWGRVLGVKVADVDRAYRWFGRYQGKTVFFCRMVPLARSLISVPAGMARMPAGRFFLLTAAGSAIWNAVIVCAGVWLGERWDSILKYLDMYSTAVYAAVAVLCVAGLCLLLFRRKKA